MSGNQRSTGKALTKDGDLPRPSAGPALTAMNTELRALIVEDSADDAELLVLGLQEEGFALTQERVDTEAGMRAALDRDVFDVVLCDQAMPRFSAFAALKVLEDLGLDVPLIVVSGKIGEEVAVDLMRQGARDFVHKAHLRRLVPALEREIKAYSGRKARRQAEAALQEVEERFRVLAETAQVGIWQAAPDGRTLYINPAMCEILEIRSANEIDPYGYQVFFTAESWQRLQAERAKRTGGERSTYEVELIGRKGTRRHMLVTGAPLWAPNGSLHSTIGTFTDISVRRRDEARLLAAKEQAEAANRAKSEFLTMMSHELRTPLNAIIGFSEMMLERVFGELNNQRHEDYVNAIHGSGKRLLEMINNILDLSKVEAGRLDLREGPIVIEQAVGECLDLLHGQAEVAQIRLTAHYAQPGLRLYGDRHLFDRILINLLSNAIKFTPGGGSVTVMAALEADGRMAVIVSDTGIGVSQSDIEKALTPFGQVEGLLTRKHDGTGLGLPLTKVLVEKHGGTLTFDSQVGIGTDVTLHFPKARVMF
ncbi:MAG: response regulator [Alphaproteobacteria bacterium]|jgi:PAS domain S-box-containing protein|nr:response regulator [Alphaproteobacteria bacterium]